jgi:hypothetical protein
MCSIYVINIGANTNHSSQARSPIFDDKSFQFVAFCADPKKEVHRSKYPPEMLPFTNLKKKNLETHNDPNWKKLTYGDDCSAPRARALKKVKHGDILLFWGLLWRNGGKSWDGFVSPLDGNKGWYLIGAMRVQKVIVANSTLESLSDGERSGIETPERLSPDERCRIEKNVHFKDRRLPTDHWVFLGYHNKEYSRLFDKAVPLWVPNSNTGDGWERSLMHRCFRSADEHRLRLKISPRWSSSLRTCRKMWDMRYSEQRKRAKSVRDAIRNHNKDFDLLKN